MYFSYGFPKAFRLWDADQSPSDVVYTCFGGDFLVVVTTTTLQIWTGGQQRLKLGEFQRDKSSVEEEGRAICACWCPSKRVIAIAVCSLIWPTTACHPQSLNKTESLSF